MTFAETAPTAPAFFAQHSMNVLRSEKAPGGMTAWHIQRNGVDSVFFSTADGSVVMSGVLWDATTGKNISDNYSSRPAVEASSKIDLSKFSSDKVPAAIQRISKLGGVKEGNAPIDKTLYIIFDPRCDHCHRVYKKSRNFVAQGGSIQWIPVAVIGGNPAMGNALIAAIMQAQQPHDVFVQIMSGVTNSALGATKPAEDTLRLAAENQKYFWEAFDSNKEAGDAGVPVAFYVNSEGIPQMVGSIDDDVLLKEIFERIKR